MAIRINRTRKTIPSSTSLRDSLTPLVPNTKCLLLENSRWRGFTSDLLINWGSTTVPSTNAFTLNTPEAVGRSVNKLATFDRLEHHGINCPETYIVGNGNYLDTRTAFLYAIYYGGHPTLLFRTTATGHGGEGIYVLKNIEEALQNYHDLEYNLSDFSMDEILDYYHHLASTPEWSEVFSRTKFISAYFKASDEYRVHVFLDNAIHVQRKGLRTDDERPEHPNFYIRNHSNGFVFQINDIDPPSIILEQSIRAIKALGLHFGAVDIRYNPTTEEYCVLEVNTAPALTGTTLDVYTETFSNFHAALQSRS